MEVEDGRSDGLRLQNPVSGRCPFRIVAQELISLYCRWTLGKGDKPPVVDVDGDSSSAFIKLTCKAGGDIKLDASQSRSPQEVGLSYKWFQYREVEDTQPVVSHITFKLSSQRI